MCAVLGASELTYRDGANAIRKPHARVDASAILRLGPPHALIARKDPVNFSPRSPPRRACGARAEAIGVSQPH